jgi:histone-lysine N-methyltransferase SETD2
MSLSPSLKEEPPSLSPSATAPAAGVKSEEDGLVIKDEQPTSFPVSPDETLRDFPPPKLEDSVSPKHSESSESSTPPPVSGKRKPKVESTGPQLIGHLPKSEKQARATFIEITENHYQYGTLGRSREALESMLCDCQYEHGTFFFVNFRAPAEEVSFL